MQLQQKTDLGREGGKSERAARRAMPATRLTATIRT